MKYAVAGNRSELAEKAQDLEANSDEHAARLWAEAELDDWRPANGDSLNVFVRDPHGTVTRCKVTALVTASVGARRIP